MTKSVTDGVLERGQGVLETGQSEDRLHASEYLELSWKLARELGVRLSEIDKEISDAFAILENAIRSEAEARSNWKEARARESLAVPNKLYAESIAANGWAKPASQSQINSRVEFECASEESKKDQAAADVKIARERIDILRDQKSITQTRVKIILSEIAPENDNENVQAKVSGIGTFKGRPIVIDEIQTVGRPAEFVSVNDFFSHLRERAEEPGRGPDSPVAASSSTSWLDDL